MVVRDQAVEAAAAAIQVRIDQTIGLNDLARAALEAAAPHMWCTRKHLFDDYKIIPPRRRLTMWSCECGWSNTGADEKCQRCFLHRPA